MHRSVKEHLLRKLMFIQVSERVTIVTKDVARKEQRAVVPTQIVQPQ